MRVSRTPGAGDAAAPGVSRRRLPRDLSRQRIVSAAAAMFGEQPYAEVSVGELAARLSMTGANIYRHFSSKRDLANAVCALHGEQALARIRGVADDPGRRAIDRIEAVVMENLRYNQENFRDAPHLVGLLRMAAIEQWPGFALMGSGLRDILGGLIAAGIADGSLRPGLADHTAHVVLMSLKSVMHPVLLDEIAPGELEPEVRRMLAFLVRALVAPAP